MFIYLSDIEPPDVIILEYKIEAHFLGAMSGPEVLDELKQRGFSIPVILITPLKWNDFKRAIDSGVIHELVEKSDLALTIISLSVQSLLSRKRLTAAYSQASHKEAVQSHLVFLGIVCVIVFLGIIIGFVNHTAYTLAGQ